MARFAPPDPDSVIARHSDGTVCALGGFKPEYPLYQTVRVILPPHESRRSYWLTWIIHRAQFKRGGDSWRLFQLHPDMHAWAAAECARELTPEDAQDAHELTPEQWDALVAREAAKYGA